MAGFLEGIGRTIGGLQAGILDARMDIQAKHQSLLNNVMRGRQENQALRSGQFVQQKLGFGPVEIAGIEGEGGFAPETLSAGRGLLADPRFLDNRSELKFAAQLMQNPESQQLGQTILGQVISQQQGEDADLRRQAVSDKAAAARLGLTDKIALDAAQIVRADKARDVALKMRTAAVKELGPIVNQIPGLSAAYDILASGSPTDAVAGIFQFMQAIEPGGIVREGEQQMVRGTGGLTNKLANLMNEAEGKGFTDTTRLQLAQTMNLIMKPRVEAAQQRQEQLRNAAALAGLSGQNVPLAAGNFGEFSLPQIPPELLGMAIPAENVDPNRFVDAPGPGG